MAKYQKYYINNYSDYIKFIVTEADFNYETINEKALTKGLDLAPGVGVVKLGVEGVFGEDLVTGRKTSNLKRILSMVPAGVSLAGKIEIKTISEATKGNSVILSMNGMGGGKNILGFKTAAESTVDNIVSGETSKILTEDAIKGLGEATQKKIDYKKVFFDEYADLEGKVVVHHGVEQQVLKKPQTMDLFTQEEMHSLENLRGIPKEINSDLHF